MIKKRQIFKDNWIANRQARSSTFIPSPNLVREDTDLALKLNRPIQYGN